MARKKFDDSYLNTEYGLGPEKGSLSPSYHAITEMYNNGVRGDLDQLDHIEYYYTPSETEADDDGDEWTTDATWELTGYDYNGDVLISGDYTKEDLEDILPEHISAMIIADEGKKDYDRIDDLRDAVWQNLSDDASPQEILNAAKNYFQGHYGESSWILPDGTVISMGDHNEICLIGDMNHAKFENIGAIRALVSGLQMIKEPTAYQYDAIKDHLRSMRSKYHVEIGRYVEGRKYPETICYAEYEPDEWRKAVADIDRYFTDGINLMSENVETEAKPSDVKISQFRKKEGLCPKIWKGYELDKRVRLKLLDIADDFWEFTGIDWVEPAGIVLTGSMCNFNWNESSDLDLHIIVDFREVDDKSDFVREFMDSKKNLWNNEHEGLNMNGIPVEIYVEDIEEPAVTGGLYDLEQEKWIRKPKHDDVKMDFNRSTVRKTAAKIMTAIENLEKGFTGDDKHKAEVIDRGVEKLAAAVKQMRQKGLDKKGEGSDGNIVYKILRNNGYLDRMWSLRTNIYDFLNSVDDDTKKIHSIIHGNKGVFGEWQQADQNNPYDAKIKHDRKLLKSFLMNNGKYMINTENGKDYMVYTDATLTDTLGVNFAICASVYDATGKLSGTVYIKPMSIFKDPDAMGNAQLAQRRQAMTGNYYVGRFDTDQ